MKMVIGSKTELGDYAKEFDIEEELTDDDGSDESGITTGTATDQASTPTRSGLRVRFTAPKKTNLMSVLIMQITIDAHEMQKERVEAAKEKIAQTTGQKIIEPQMRRRRRRVGQPLLRW